MWQKILNVYLWAMNFPDIMAEPVLSTEKSCLLARATYFVTVLNALLKK